MCVCVSLASDTSETVEVIIKFGMVTASDMVMHHVLIIWTLIFILGHTDRNHENNNCSIISETIQAIPIKFAVKIVRLKVDLYNIFSVLWPCSSLKVTTVSQTWQLLNLYYNSHISDSIYAMAHKRGMTIDLYMAYMLMLLLMTLTLMQGHSGSANI